MGEFVDLAEITVVRSSLVTCAMNCRSWGSSYLPAEVGQRTGGDRRRKCSTHTQAGGDRGVPQNSDFRYRRQTGANIQRHPAR